MVNNLAEVFFQNMNASLGAVGLTSLFHLPWNLKFLWAPFADRIETKKRWLVVMQLLCATFLLALGLFATGPEMLALASAFFLLLAVASATNDIAIDGYYMEALDGAGQSKFVGYRAMAYKVSNLLVRGPLLIVAGIVGWQFGFVSMAAIIALLALGHAVLLPRAEQRKLALRDVLRDGGWLKLLFGLGAVAMGAWLLRSLGLVRWWKQTVSPAVGKLPFLGSISLAGWIGLGLLLSLLVLLAFLPTLLRRLRNNQSHYARAFVQFLQMRQVGTILAFVILFRTGESFLQKMKWPFLDEVIGITTAEYGIANGTVGVAASFAATMLGGALIARHGLRRWLWPFLFAQNGLNLLYVALASSDALQAGGLPVVTVIIACEEFGAGLGTAVFMVYLMRLCHPDHKAAHFAILTALMSVTFTIAGSASGFLAQVIGFTGYFAFTFLASIPMMLLATRVPHLE